MSGWVLLGRVVVVWIAVSVVGVGGFVAAAELARWWHNRRRCTVTPLYPQSSHVRVVPRDTAS